MVKVETLKPGDVLYDVHSYRMGNTTLRSMGCWPVKIIEIRPGGAMVSWNHNRPDFRSNHSLRKLRRKEPEMESVGFGMQRLKRRTKKEPTNADR